MIKHLRKQLQSHFHWIVVCTIPHGEDLKFSTLALHVPGYSSKLVFGTFSLKSSGFWTRNKGILLPRAHVHARRAQCILSYRWPPIICGGPHGSGSKDSCRDRCWMIFFSLIGIVDEIVKLVSQRELVKIALRTRQQTIRASCHTPAARIPLPLGGCATGH